MLILTEPAEIHPRNLKEPGEVITELLAKSLRFHREQKTLQSEEKLAENELLRKSERNLEENGKLYCFNTSEI